MTYGEVERPKALTPCAPETLYDVVRGEWDAIYQSLPEHRPLLVVLAHWAFETDWGHSCFGWNVGNRKHVPGCGHDWMTLRTWEHVNGVDVPQDARFVAYDSLEDGVHDYLVHLRAEFRFAWPAVLAGDPADFCHRLKASGYYTAPEPVYTAGLTSCFWRLGRMIADPLANLPQVAQAAILSSPRLVQPDPPGDLPT